MIHVVCFKWRHAPRPGHVEPPHPVDYDVGHVHRLRSMVARHLSMSHEFVCITDDPAGLFPYISTLPLWPDCAELGGNYRKLRLFAPEMEGFVGSRILYLDLDLVITDSIDPVVDRPEDFVINSIKANARRPQQWYNSSMILMDAGARRQVWEQFQGEESVRAVQEANIRGEVSGTDQAWVRMVLGQGEARWTEVDGVYEAPQVKRRLPSNARVIGFAGNRDPSEWCDVPWVQEHYR